MTGLYAHRPFYLARMECSGKEKRVVLKNHDVTRAIRKSDALKGVTGENIRHSVRTALIELTGYTLRGEGQEPGI